MSDEIRKQVFNQMTELLTLYYAEHQRRVLDDKTWLSCQCAICTKAKELFPTIDFEALRPRQE